MSSVLYLAWKYVAYHRLKSSILVASLSITILLPLTVGLLLGEYDHRLLERSRQTPLLVGAAGNRFDLLLQALYFRPGSLEPVPWRLVDEIEADRAARALPLHLRYTARAAPVVGTSLDYLEFRGLSCDRGRLPGLLGEAVLGAEVARRLDLAPGDRLLTDQRNLYNLAASAPVNLLVSGVLAAGGTADDHAIFTDVKTAWILEGLGHGHDDVTATERADLVRRREPGHVEANAAVVPYIEITPENRSGFHFHGATADFPLSGIIIVPRDQKARDILRTRYDARSTLQVLAPLEVTEELLALVFRIKRLFDANFVLVCLSTGLLLTLVILLSLRLRRRERETLHKLGASSGLIFWLQATELIILGGASLAISIGLATLGVSLAPDLFRLLR